MFVIAVSLMTLL